MRPAVVAVLALAGVATARVARTLAASERPPESEAAPYTPSPTAAPFVTLGFRELGADLLYVRMIGYFGGGESEAHAVASLAEAITTLDPRFPRAYEIGAVAATGAKYGVDNDARLRAIALLRRASELYPTVYKYPNLAGQIYLVDLQTTDPAQRRAWDEQGMLLLESAARKPGAPAEAALYAATLQTRLGQQQHAIDSLRELMLITTDTKARAQIIERLAKLTEDAADEIAAEMLEARRTFERTWKDQRPALPPSMFILVGPPPAPGFDLGDLAAGGRDLIGTEGFERLEPLTDP